MVDDSTQGSLLFRLAGIWRAIGAAAASVERSRLGLTLEIARFSLRTGLGPMYFIRTEMHRPDFPKADQFKHISDREYHAALDKLNPPAYRKLTQYKLSEKALYRLLNIHSSAFRLFYDARAGIDDKGQPVTSLKDFRHWLENNQGLSVCIKPLELWGGALVLTGRIECLDGKAGVQPLGNRDFIDAGGLLAEYGQTGPASFMVEDYICQAPSFARYNTSSVNTVRLWVLDEGERIDVIGAYLRVGRAGAMADNGDVGGVLFPVDLPSGMLKPGFFSLDILRSNFICHPDSSEVIAGTVVDRWPEICQFGCDVLRNLPHTRFAGLDVALTEKGAILIETNVQPDRGGASFSNIATMQLKRCADALR